MAFTGLKLIVTIALFLSVANVCITGHTIKHVVNVMLENRAFDHMCGFLKRMNAHIEGLYGNETNPYDPNDPNSPIETVNDRSSYVNINPGHSYPDATEQAFGCVNCSFLSDPAPMNGFVANTERNHAGWGSEILSCFSPENVPVISTLAMEFALFDRWYSSVPGPTEVNRMYVHSSTSHGASSNDVDELIIGYPQKTIFQSLEESNKTWNVYFEEVTTTLFFKEMRKLPYLLHLKRFEEFIADVVHGTLPNYSFIEPSYFSVYERQANDQHPSHNVAQGELFLRKIYDVLRNSKLWNDVLLIITYDEHGGFYDHFPTPMNDIPNPDGINAINPPFDFTRLGIRVPTVMISPWINKGLVVHDPIGPTPTSKFEYSSIVATLKNLFDLPNFLTKRDAWSGTFEKILDERSSPRNDCPFDLPTPPSSLLKQSNAEKESKQPLNDLQIGLTYLASALNGDEDTLFITQIMSEEEGSAFISYQMDKFFKRNLLTRV